MPCAPQGVQRDDDDDDDYDDDDDEENEEEELVCRKLQMVGFLDVHNGKTGHL
jgi:hypothetical protein